MAGRWALVIAVIGAVAAAQPNEGPGEGAQLEEDTRDVPTVIDLCDDEPLSGLNLKGEPATCAEIVKLGACDAGPEVLAADLVATVRQKCPRSCNLCKENGQADRSGVSVDDLVHSLWSRLRTLETKLKTVMHDMAVRESSPACIGNPFSPYCRALHSDFFEVQQPYQGTCKTIADHEHWKSKMSGIEAMEQSRLGHHERAMDLMKHSFGHYLNKRDLERMSFLANLPEFRKYTDRSYLNFPTENVDEITSMVSNYLSLKNLDDARRSNSAQKRQALANLQRAYRMPSRPITPEGYSTAAYQAQLINRLAPVGASLSIDTLPPTISWKELQRDYISELKPFKISKGLFDHWPAMKKWTKAGLLKHYGGLTVNASSKGATPQYFLIGKTADFKVFFVPPGQQERKGFVIQPLKIGKGWAEYSEFDCNMKPTDGLSERDQLSCTVKKLVANEWEDVFTAANEAAAEGADVIFVYGDGLLTDKLGTAPINKAVNIQVGVLSEEAGHLLNNFVLTGGGVIKVSGNEMMDFMPNMPDGMTPSYGHQPKMQGSSPVNTGETEEQQQLRLQLDKERIAFEGAAPQEMAMAIYVNDILTHKKFGNLSHPEVRYIFNTMGNGVQAGYDRHPLREDFDGTPQLLLDAINGVLSPGSGYFQFFLGPALSGAVPHYHNSAWNALVAGRKHWVLIPHDKYMINEIQNRNDMNIEDPPVAPSFASAYTWFKKGLPKIRERYPGTLYEFVQEAGEFVWIPPNYGHAILNLQPSVGVAETLGEYNVTSATWDNIASIKDLLQKKEW